MVFEPSIAFLNITCFQSNLPPFLKITNLNGNVVHYFSTEDAESRLHFN